MLLTTVQHLRYILGGDSVHAQHHLFAADNVAAAHTFSPEWRCSSTLSLKEESNGFRACELPALSPGGHSQH